MTQLSQGGEVVEKTEGIAAFEKWGILQIWENEMQKGRVPPAICQL